MWQCRSITLLAGRVEAVVVAAIAFAAVVVAQRYWTRPRPATVLSRTPLPGGLRPGTRHARRMRSWSPSSSVRSTDARSQRLSEDRSFKRTPSFRGGVMSVAKVIEITAQSPESFEDAIRRGIAKAGETVRNISGAWVKEQNVAINNGQVIGYRVDLKVTFLLD
jgi:flavin-binding protein dodecin